MTTPSQTDAVALLPELAPCPFCGEQPLLSRDRQNVMLRMGEEPTDDHYLWHVMHTCKSNVSIGGHSMAKDKAIAAWNRRAPAPQVPDRPTTARSYSMPRELPMPKYEFQNPPFVSVSSPAGVGGQDQGAVASLLPTEGQGAAVVTPEDWWIEWPGGARPVDRYTLVIIRRRDGREVCDKAFKFDWTNENYVGVQSDIVAYRIEAPSPATGEGS